MPKNEKNKVFPYFEIPHFFDLDLDFHLQINSYILILCLVTDMLFLVNVTLAFLFTFIYPS